MAEQGTRVALLAREGEARARLEQALREAGFQGAWGAEDVRVERVHECRGAHADEHVGFLLHVLGNLVCRQSGLHGQQAGYAPGKAGQGEVHLGDLPRRELRIGLHGGDALDEQLVGAQPRA